MANAKNWCMAVMLCTSLLFSCVALPEPEVIRERVEEVKLEAEAAFSIIELMNDTYEIIKEVITWEEQ